MTDIDLVTALYAALERRDLGAVRPYIAPDFVMDQPDGLPWSGRYYGPDGFMSFFHTLNDYLEATTETEIIFDGGGTVVQIGCAEGTIRANAAPFRTREVHLLNIRDGLVVRFRAYVQVPVMQAALDTVRA